MKRTFWLVLLDIQSFMIHRLGLFLLLFNVVYFSYSQSDTSAIIAPTDSVVADTVVEIIEKDSSVVNNDSTALKIVAEAIDTSITVINEITDSITTDSLVVLQDTLTVASDTASIITIDSSTTVKIDTIKPRPVDNIDSLQVDKNIVSDQPLLDTTSATDKSETAVDSFVVEIDSIKTIVEADSTILEEEDTSLADQDTTEIELPQFEETSKTETQPEIVSDKLLVIRVNDSTNHAGIKAKVRMTLINENARNYTGAGMCNARGEFKMFLNPDSRFILNTGAPNYTPRTDTFDLADFDKDTVEINLSLLKLEVGKVIRLAGVNFAQGKYQLLPSSYPVLNNLVDLMNANPKMIIQLEGHTDNSGSKNASIKLSEERVNSVRFYLIQKGIKASRIKGVGYGGSRPLVSGSSPEALRMNRRVEFEILKM